MLFSLTSSLLLLLCLSVAVPGGAASVAPRPFTPDLRHQVDALMREAVAKQHLAGVSLAIAKDGNVIYAQGYGYRNIARALPAMPDTIYNIASISKQFAAASVMLLQEDGKLHVDEPVGRYVRSFPWGGVVTVRQLLNHTSGIPDYLSIVDNNSLTLPKIVAALRKTRLKFRPGSLYQYSNSNYVLLGVLVSAVSNITYEDFLRRRILSPQRLTATSIGTTPLDMPNGATGYTVIKGRTTAVDPRADSAGELDFADGGVNTNVLDLIRWDWALDNARVVSRDSLRLMFTPSHHRSDWPHGYGFGLGIDQVHGHWEIVHEGEWTGFAGENATFPDDGFAIVMLANTDGFSEDALKRRIFRLFYP